MLIGYARVSTVDQNPQAQLDALLAAGCEKVFHEKASGAKADRLQLAAALDYMRDGDTLVVWKLDRLARSLKQLMETMHGLEARGIGLRSITEAIDTTTAGGRLVFHVFGAIGEFERSLIRERTLAGLQAARKRGASPGRPAALDDKQKAVARTLLDGGMAVAAVAKHLGVSRSTLYRQGVISGKDASDAA